MGNFILQVILCVVFIIIGSLAFQFLLNPFILFFTCTLRMNKILKSFHAFYRKTPIVRQIILTLIPFVLFLAILFSLCYYTYSSGFSNWTMLVGFIIGIFCSVRAKGRLAGINHITCHDYLKANLKYINFDQLEESKEDFRDVILKR